MRLIFSILSFILFVISAQARPVSFVGGVTAIVSYDAKETSSLLHYTVNPKASIGLKTIFRDGLRTSINAVETNYLVKRINGENHQANFYLHGGLGLASIDLPNKKSEMDPLAYLGMATDWEDRRFYLSYKNNVEFVSGQTASLKQSARIGLAPYVADSGKLHTWLMFEMNHHPSDENGDYTIRPIVRFFKDAQLVEVGINNHKEVMVNWIGRY